ncbi:MAG: endonuclease/exonuclease/phosphatase family protein [Rhodopirellula sp. JB044]|uniref:endonuclease/exonuclease/phosphatase family protein n=1 Tax=Rhodopirellula sp. JB044 TaxID=3342844 RepID=UPI00370B0ABE
MTHQTTHAETQVPPRRSIRIASMNVSLYGDSSGRVADRLRGGSDAQAIKLAKIIRSIRPDVLLLCEVDFDADGKTLNRFADLYLNAKQEGSGEPISYPHRWSIPTNTGMIADADLDADGRTDLPNDAWGFGRYPGQYAMAVLSRFPIDRENARTFQTYRWNQLPGALRPIDPQTNVPYYSDEVWQKLRLSSKNHADVPIQIPAGSRTNRVLHFLVSHPTPPVFDGPEDRNGCRNHDEIRFWQEFIEHPDAEFLVDDAGVSGGLAKDEWFAIAGDLNSDPEAGDSRRSAIVNLLSSERVQPLAPESETRSTATALFGTRRVRVDYVIPSANIPVVDSGVVWPEPNTPLGRCLDATDHRMVWIDMQPISDDSDAP